MEPHSHRLQADDKGKTKVARKMRLLELFCGSKSIGKEFEKRGWQVTSLDIDPKFEPDIVANVLEFEYKALDQTFDHVHASPPCTQYSIARTTGGPRDLEGADRIVARALEIIRFCCERNPRCTWTMENPQTGYLKTREVVQGIEFYDVCYCKYSCRDYNPGYRKATRFWTNMFRWKPKPMCTKEEPCAHKVGRKHPKAAQRGPRMFNGVREASRLNQFSQTQLYAIPPSLCAEIAEAASLG